MKQQLLLLITLFSLGAALAQTDGMTYQAVIVDLNEQQIPGVDIPSNNLPNTPLSVRFTILNAQGGIDYEETHLTETDPYGMINLTIGQGNSTAGASFTDIYWADEKTLNVQINLNDGNGYVDFSSQSLTYIPYVKHREIIASSTLDVDGETNLNSELTVNNQATTLLTGDLYVEGSAYFQDGNFVNLFVTENTEMNVVDIFGPTTIEGMTTIDNSFNVINGNPTSLTGTLDVTGITDLNSDLNVLNNGNTNLTGDLTVGGSAFFQDGNFVNLYVTENTEMNVVDIAGPTNINGVTTIDNTLNVINGNVTNLTGTVDVAGITNLSNDLNVLNNSDTNLTGDLTVGGQATFGIANFTNIGVSGTSSLNVLNTTGPSNLGGNLWVTNDSATTLSGTLNVQGTSSFTDQVVINADVNGGQGATASYPLRVRGSNQGILVQVDGFGTNANNYMSFGDGTAIRGAIEGQSFADVEDSYEYNNEFLRTLKEQGFLGAEGVACGLQLDGFEAAAMGLQVIAETAFGVDILLYFENNRGVYFKSGGADYAEYLPKSDVTETFHKGDVVGVVGGKISKNTKGASKIMAISSNPIVLGNLQGDGHMENYEKVAFIGQVPVKVFGAVAIGDYVLASGNNDGGAIAKHPNQMQIEDYSSIVGVAWEASKNPTVNLINTAVGLNTNDLAGRLQEQEKELRALKSQVAQILARLDGKEVSEIQEEEKSQPLAAQVKLPEMSSNGGFESWLAAHKDFYIEHTNKMKQRFVANNVDLSRYKTLSRWLNDPIGSLRAMEAGKLMPTMWQQIRGDLGISK